MTIDVKVIKRQGKFLLDAEFGGPGTEMTALFGPSGAGKTSLLNLVAGITRPDAGRIAVNGRVLFDSDQGIDLAPEARRIGYVFQDGRLFPHLSVRNNLTYGMKLTPADLRYLDFDRVVELLDVGPLLGRRPARLSGGEKQRVAIGRALLTSPQLLLLDEPLSSLDAARREEVLPFIRRVCEQSRVSIIYVSHGMDEICRMASTIVFLEQGRIVSTRANGVHDPAGGSGAGLGSAPAEAARIPSG